MIYICDACGIKPIKVRSIWIDHVNTNKHKKNLYNATHTCLNCNSCFVYDKKSVEYKKNLKIIWIIVKKV